MLHAIGLSWLRLVLYLLRQAVALRERSGKPASHADSRSDVVKRVATSVADFGVIWLVWWVFMVIVNGELRIAGLSGAINLVRPDRR